MSSWKALVIDDSQAMRHSIACALQRIDALVCFEAKDGAEGLKKLAGERFDIILTDINMPVMDGLKVIACVRGEDSVNRKTPVVVISTQSAIEDQQRAMRLGANAYLVKPLRPNKVIETVRGLLMTGVSGVAGCRPEREALSMKQSPR